MFNSSENLFKKLQLKLQVNRMNMKIVMFLSDFENIVFRGKHLKF